jgi:outer membrane biogenesis lipoprotein LolB
MVMKKSFLLLFSSSLLLVACTSVKPYQKSRLNDSEMQLTARKVEKTDMNFQSYREASSGANGGKTGGGCGCN